MEYSARFYKNSDLSKIDSLADYFQLDLNKKITDLSFGNKKKCSIIQSVIHQPKLLILDEPTSGLDPLMQNRFFDLLEEENKKGKTGRSEARGEGKERGNLIENTSSQFGLRILHHSIMLCPSS